jgi:hypothetical protein
MRRKRPKIVQRCFLALALLGAALHVGAFAWHPYARSWTILAERQLLADVQATICHSTGLITSSDAPGDRRTPPTPAHKTDCLICQGMAHVCFAIHASTMFVLFAAAAPGLSYPARVAFVAGAPKLPPRSRGPPIWLH